MSVQAETNAATENINVQRAFRLGWRFAQLYHNPHRATLEASARNGKLPKHLPSLSELSDGNRTELILREIQHDVAAIKPALSAADDPVSLDTLLNVMRGPIDSKGKKTQIVETFRLLRIQIGADDARLSTAIDLGRMLADTVIPPDASGSFKAEFDHYRLQNAYDWLEDLHTSFPKNAADAVRGSLQYWEEWANNPSIAARAADDTYAKRALTLQGERWRRLLSGEIFAESLLAAENYRQAASEYLSRTARLTLSFVRRYWPAVTLVLGGTGAIIWTILNYAPTGAASVAAVIATAAGSLGISWKGVGSTLGKVAAKLEQPLWTAEVLEAIIVATFIPPVKMKSREFASLRKQAGEPKALPAPLPERGQLGPAADAGGTDPNGEVGNAPAPSAAQDATAG
jgi:hypothetical protein